MSSSTKLFIGCAISSEVRMHLNSSIQWKHAVLSAGHAMQEVHYQGKDYLGRYLANNQIKINELATIQSEINQQLKIYCPKLEKDPQICIFSQVFIA